MTKENFKNLYTEAGFKSKNELAKALNLSYSAVTQWGCGDVKFPPYLKAVLEWAVKAKKYDEALKKGLDESEKPKECPSEALSLENARLREELREYEELKRVLKRVLE